MIDKCNIVQNMKCYIGKTLIYRPPYVKLLKKIKRVKKFKLVKNQKLYIYKKLVIDNIIQFLIRLVHGLNQFVDEFFTVTERTTLDEVLELSWNTPTTGWVGQLEWPQEVVSLLEVWTNSDDFVNQIIDRQNTVLTQVSFNDSVVGQRNSLLVDLTVTSLVQKLSNSRVGWVTVSDVWFNQLQQFNGSLGDLDESTRVDLVQSQKLQNLSWLWSNLVDTLNSDDEDQLVLSFNVEGTSSLSITLSLDDRSFSSFVLLLVSSVSLQNDSSLFLVSLIIKRNFSFLKMKKVEINIVSNLFLNRQNYFLLRFIAMVAKNISKFDSKQYAFS